MRLTPRGPEVAHVRAAIDKDHASADAAAKAAIKAVAEALDFRNWYVIAEGYRTESGGQDALLWGLFASEIEAEKALAQMQALGGCDGARVYPVLTTASALARAKDIPLTGDCKCGHPKAWHVVPSNAREKCGLSSCDCKKFVEHKFDIPTHPTCVTCKQSIPA